MKSFLFILFLCPISLSADIKSTTGTIQFNSNSDSNSEMTLNDTGLGVGTTPSANLHIQGNAIISDHINIGSHNGSSNLNIHGSLGFGFEQVSTDANLGSTSVVLANSNSDNIELSLPNPALAPGQTMTIKKVSYDNRVTISSNTLIDHSSLVSLGVGYNSICLINNGSQWYETSSYGSNITKDPSTFASNCLMWFDGNDASSIELDSNGNITQWSDKSGNDYHATRSTTLQPTFTEDAINGRAAIDFTRDDFQFLLTSTTVPIRGEMTFFIIAEMKSGGSNDGSSQMLCWDGTSDNGSNRIYEFSCYNGSSSFGFREDSNITKEQAGTLSPGLDTPFLTTAYRDKSIPELSTQMNRESALSTTFPGGTSGNTTVATTGQLNIGINKNVNARYHYGYIGEIIIYNKRLSTEEIELLQTYLIEKWGL